MLIDSVEVPALKSLIPASIRHRLSRLVLDMGALPEIARRALAGPAPGGPPRVFYGRGSLPPSREFAHGGLVKVQRMQTRWPNTAGAFNTLYMVSSAMPPGARWWAVLAKRRGATFVWNQNGVSSPAWEGSNWRATNAAMRPLLREADHVFYQSEFCKLAADRFLGPPLGTWEVLHNSVDTRAFVPRPTPLPEAPLMLLLGGNQSERYRLETAIATLGVLVRRGVDARLLISGHLRWFRDPNQAKREAQEMVKREQVADRVEFTGPYTQEEALALLHRVHILLHTKYNDPCPGVVIEALACGLPVVYSASGGVPELVGEEAGIGVPVESTFDRMIPPDPEALATGVERVRASLARYAAAARDRAVQRFDIEPWMARHAEIFERKRP